MVSRAQLALNVSDLGVEVACSADVEADAARLRSAGLAATDERDTTCCYARQDKIWLHDPAGTRWEVYVVTDDNPQDASPPRSTSPSGDVAEPGACCA